MAHDVHQELPGGVHLGVKVRLGQARELYVVEGMDANLVPLHIHPLHQVTVVAQVLPHQEEGGLHPPLGQAVQEGGGGGAAGAVVKGEGNELLPALPR